MFQIKICGIKAVKDAHLAMLAGADAIGLNFYAKSVRHIDPDMAAKIVKALPPKITKIGVFVNAGPDEVNQVAEQLSLDAVQLHGDEPPESIAQLKAAFVVRAFRYRDNGADVIRKYLEACEAGRSPDAILVDAFKVGEYGGTGESFDWKALAENRKQFPEIPLILAGGLTPFNVANAIATVQPTAVDSASGVESDGQKDPMLVRAFCQAAKKAFAAL